jgi:ATP-dependent RNA helicase DDX24/MAK5
MGQKRGRDSKASAAEANKRKKAVKADGADDERSVSVGELNWKEVAMPDRMEDAEGFFGLEEIDGVDIIKQSGGEVQFKVRGHIFFDQPYRAEANIVVVD